MARPPAGHSGSFDLSIYFAGLGKMFDNCGSA
jgi:hypothetical protein